MSHPIESSDKLSDDCTPKLRVNSWISPFLAGKWKWKVAQLYPTLRSHGLHSPWNSPCQNTRLGSLSLLRGIFPTQGLNPRSPAMLVDSLPAEPQGKPKNTSLIAQWVKNPPALQETPVRFLAWEDLLEKDRLPTLVFLGFPCGSVGRKAGWLFCMWNRFLLRFNFRNPWFPRVWGNQLEFGLLRLTHWWSPPLVFFFFFFYFHWSMVDLQCCVTFWYTALIAEIPELVTEHW